MSDRTDQFAAFLARLSMGDRILVFANWYRTGSPNLQQYLMSREELYEMVKKQRLPEPPEPQTQKAIVKGDNVRERRVVLNDSGAILNMNEIVGKHQLGAELDVRLPRFIFNAQEWYYLSDDTVISATWVDLAPPPVEEAIPLIFTPEQADG